jgi:hypothetical protein
MSSCDPCSADPLTPEELQKAGVFWLDSPNTSTPNLSPGFRRIRPMPTSNRVFISRFHVRYSRDKFPEDLMFKETTNQESFQGRYVLRHAFEGEARCEAGQQYQKSLPVRYEQEAKTLAQLTGWNIQDIRRKLKLPTTGVQGSSFWRTIWK